MKTYTRSFRDLLVATLAAGAVVSCDDATRPKTSGELVPNVMVAEIRPSILARLTTPNAVTVQVNGAGVSETKSLALKSNGRWEGRVSVPAGTYEVLIFATDAGALQYFGRNPAVTVNRGDRTDVPVTLGAAIPEVDAPPLANTTSFSQEIPFSAVVGATTYTVQFSQSPTFAGTPDSIRTTDLSPLITVNAIGTWHVRTRAVVPVNGLIGEDIPTIPWSNTRSWTVLESEGGDDATDATPVTNIPGTPESIIERNITPTKPADWFEFPVRAGDSLFIETFAGRLTPNASSLDTRLTLFRADGTTQLSQNDNQGSTSDARIGSPAAGFVALHTETYKVRVDGMNGTVGHYEITMESRRLPAAPSGLTGTVASGTQVNLVWADNSDNETNFVVERCAGVACSNFAVVQTVVAGSTSYNDTGLTQNTQYSWRVRAINTFGTSPASNTFSVGTFGPAAPSALVATTIGATQVNLSWTDNATNELGFRVYRCTGAGCVNLTLLADIATPNTLGYNDVGVVYGQSYRYLVSAYNNVIDVPAADTAAANTLPPATPSSLTATVTGPTAIQLAWTDNSSDELGFYLERCLGDACSNFQPVDTLPANTVTVSDATVANNAGYRYRIRAFHVVTSQDYSNIANGHTRPPAAPTSLTATTLGATSIQLAWTDNASDETGYSVQRCQGVGCTPSVQISLRPADATGYTDNTAVVDSVYSYRIVAVGIAGNSTASNTSTANTLRPAAPSALTATTLSADSIGLAWTDNSNNETGFTIQRCSGVGCGGFATLTTVGAGVLTYRDTTTNAGISYSYRIFATNISGSSANSNTATANTFAPATPTALVSSTVSGSRIDLSWTNNAPEATEMRIERCTGVACGDFEEIDVVPAAQVTYQNIGGSFPVHIDSSYTYRIRAQNAADVSAYSSTSTSHTFQPSAPGSFTATTLSPTDVSFTWSASTPDITGYEIQRCDGVGCDDFAFLSGTDQFTFASADASVTLGNDYSYRIRAVNIVGPGPFSTVATVNTRVPATPTGLTSTVLVNLVRLNWTDAADNEQSFIIERCSGAACSPTDYDTIATPGTQQWDDSTTVANLEYTYRVRAENVSGASAPTAGVVANTLIADQITVLSAVAVSPSEISVTWTPSASQGTGLITNYLIYRCAGVCDPTTTGTNRGNVIGSATTFADTGLATDSDFTYTVVPATTYGMTTLVGSPTAYASTAVPAAPTGLTATLMSATSIQLDWTDNAGNETEFELAQCSGAGCTNFVIVETLGVDVETFLADTLTFNTEYRFLVRAKNTAGPSAWTDTVSIGTTVPAAPTAADAIISTFDTNIQLSWSDASDDETTFEIDVCEGDGCTNFALAATVGANVTSEYMGNAPPLVFRLQVRAVNAAGSSAPSNAVQITGGAPYAAPTGTIATTTGPTSIELTWSDQTDNETTFNILRCTGGGCDPFSGTLVSSEPRNTTSYLDASVGTGALYRYVVIAVNGAGEAASTEFDGHTMPADAPGALSATALSNTNIALLWSDGGDFETGYAVERCDGPACSDFEVITTVPANFVSYNDVGLSQNVTYRYRVRGINAVAPSAYSNIVEKITDLPSAPTSLAALAMTGTRIDLSWMDNATNEDFYIVERCAGICDENGVFTEIETGLAPNSLGYSDVTVSASQTYSFRVRALNSGGVSPYSNIVTAITAAPTDPSGLTATTLSGTLIQLTWSDNASNELSYQVERCASAACPTFTLRATLNPGTTEYVDTVAVDDIYTYRVRAVNNVGASGYTSEETASVLRPFAASDFFVTTVSGTRIDLTWTDNSTTEDGYIVERCAGAGCSDFAEIASLPADATSFENSGIAPQTSFSYRVYAYNIAGPSDIAGPLTATTITPAAPTGLAAVLAAPGQIDLSWTDNANNEIQYRVERCSAGTTKCATADSMNVYAVEVATLGVDANSHSDPGLAPSTLYFYRVRATNIAGTSAYSAIVSRSTAVPPAPTGLAALTVLGTRIDLTWTDASATEEGFRVERCIGAGPCGVFVQIAQLPANTTSHQDSTLSPGQEVTYRVLSYNGGGGNASNTASATTIVPATPSAFVANPESQLKVSLTWTDNAVDEAGFYLERCTGLACTDFVPLDTLGVNVAAHIDSTVAGNTAYRYRLRAFGNGASDYTAIAAAATTPPNAATDLVATPISDTRIDLTWTDNTPTDSLWNETSFEVYRCEGVACTPTSGDFHVSIGRDTTFFSDSLLTPGSEFTYYVQAVNLASVAAPSNTATAATTVPAIPTSLTDSTVSATAVLLSWADNAVNEDGYEIEICTGLGCTDFAPTDTAAADAVSFEYDGLTSGVTYQFRIRGFNATGSSGYSNIVSAQSDVPPAPNSMFGQIISPTQVNLSWSDNAENETAYIVERCDGTGCSTFAVIDSLAADTEAVQDATIAIDTIYTYRVRASNAAGASPYTLDFTVSTYRPQTPATLVAVPISATRVDLTWTDVAVNDTVIIVERCLGFGCSVFTDIDSLAPTSVAYSDTTVTVNNTYNYRLRAENAAGASAPTDSVEVGTFIPSDPSSLTATTNNPTQITLNWSDNSNTEIDFLIQRCEGIACVDFDSLIVVGEDETSYADLSVTLGNSYSYQVIARGGGGNSAPSAEATAHTFPAGAVATLTSAPLTATTLHLDWDAADFATLYQISTVVGVDTTIFGFTSSSVTDTVVTVASGNIYTFVVHAANAAGAGAAAGTVIAMTPPPAPVNLTVYPLSTSQASLAWSDTTSRETGFEVERAFFNAGSFGAYATVATLGADVTSHINTVPAPTGRYKYRVRALNQIGAGDYSNEVDLTLTGPAATSALGSTITAPGQITLNWTDNSDSEQGFSIERSIGNNFTYSQIAVVGAGVTSHVDSAGIAINTQYFYRLRAVNNIGASLYSNEATSTTTVPAAIVPLASPILSSTSIQLNWNGAGTTGELGFRVYRCIGVGCVDFTLLDGSLAPDVSTYTDVTATYGAVHRYQVRPYNIAGEPTPNPIYGITLVLPNVGSVFALPIDRTSQLVRWSPPATMSWETGFEIERCQGSSCSDFVQIATPAANDSTAVSSGLTGDGVYYRYRVRAVADGNVGPWSGLVLSNTPKELVIGSQNRSTTAELTTGASNMTHYVVTLPAGAPRMEVVVGDAPGGVTTTGGTYLLLSRGHGIERFASQLVGALPVSDTLCNPGAFVFIGAGQTGGCSLPHLGVSTDYYITTYSNPYTNLQITALPGPTLYTFNNCTATGRLGPSLGQCSAAYTGTSLDGQVVVQDSGTQVWEAPFAGRWAITAVGAAGVSAQAGLTGGRGAQIYGEFVFTEGQTLMLAVGQMGSGAGSGGNGGGGGGTFVYDVGGATPLLIAGGGGGTRVAVAQNGCDASTSTFGIAGSGSSGTSPCTVKVSGSGLGGIVSSSSWGSPGGGFNSNGADDAPYGTAGRGWSAFLVGGNESPDWLCGTGYGGFGGGGAGAGCNGGGGGGGYSGGDGGMIGGGGGSFNLGTNQQAAAGIGTGHGYIIFKYLGPN
jgi:fibronectin type 3 domain-containing protein